MSPDSTITYADQTTQSTGFDINTIMSIIVAYMVVCGVVTALIARHNNRSVALAFISGALMGHLGISAHMIMGRKTDK